MNDLRSYEKCYRSQGGEDGIIEEIIRRTGVRGLAVEIGSHYEYGNCYFLAERDWPVLFVDSQPEYIITLSETYPKASYLTRVVTPENINEIVPPETVLLSIDIDGPDYWVWQALECKPAIVVIEFNPIFQPPKRVVMPRNNYLWATCDQYGASLSAMADLGKAKGYKLATTDACNCFFVRSDFDVEDQDPGELWFVPSFVNKRPRKHGFGIGGSCQYYAGGKPLGSPIFRAATGLPS